jgi:Leucine-rich repeat (LRR) protein
LSYNRLTELPESIEPLDSVRVLNLSNNWIQSIPGKCFIHLPELRHLDLSSNRIYLFTTINGESQASSNLNIRSVFST